MISTIFQKLPFDIIREILLYDNHYIARKIKNKTNLVYIDKINKNDKRFLLYDKIPKISLAYCSVTLYTLNKKFIIHHFLHTNPNLIWEYSFITYSKDPHTNIFNYMPDSVIYLYF